MISARHTPNRQSFKKVTCPFNFQLTSQVRIIAGVFGYKALALRVQICETYSIIIPGKVSILATGCQNHGAKTAKNNTFIYTYACLYICLTLLSLSFSLSL